MEKKDDQNQQDQGSKEAEAVPTRESYVSKIAARYDTASLVDNVSSYLGSHNPLGHPVDSSDTVWLLDNTAYRAPNFPHHWSAEFVTAYFLKNSGKDLGKAVAGIADQIGLGQNGENEEDGKKLIESRIQPFLNTILPARTVKVDFGGQKGDREIKILGPAGRDGISSDIHKIEGDEYKDGESVTSEAVMPDASEVTMATGFAEPEGWGFISDIDDSIKVTMTPSAVGILRTTFASEPVPITGQPEFYAHVAKTLSPTWFYLSASPYNLYPFLHTFISQTYPHGTIILRDASWMDITGYIVNCLTQGTQAYKVNRMDKIHKWLPKRKMLCLGDSTQSDPEAYGEIYRKYEGWVKKIFIRKVTDIAELDETEKNSDDRFEKAFRGVPKEVWRTFTDPKDLYEAVDALKES
ncbi:MAG: hypothetical protein M1827_000085 [Pycnora praestabilis]|nr:MAG: hypothetical protein M1827_000085 [Pycnora praestabilis]